MFLTIANEFRSNCNNLSLKIINENTKSDFNARNDMIYEKRNNGLMVLVFSIK